MGSSSWVQHECRSWSSQWTINWWGVLRVLSYVRRTPEGGFSSRVCVSSVNAGLGVTGEQTEVKGQTWGRQEDHRGVYFFLLNEPWTIESCCVCGVRNQWLRPVWQSKGQLVWTLIFQLCLCTSTLLCSPISWWSWTRWQNNCKCLHLI